MSETPMKPVKKAPVRKVAAKPVADVPSPSRAPAAAPIPATLPSTPEPAGRRPGGRVPPVSRRR